MPLDAELAYLAWLSDQEQTRQHNIVTARNYYHGHHDVKLTKRQEEFLGYNLKDERFAVNYCAPIINAVTERLLVRGFTGDEMLTEVVLDWWRQARMDALQLDIHERAIVDGEVFVYVDWLPAEGRAMFYPQPRYTDPEQGGTGEGCKAFYRHGDPNQPLEKVSKRWTETYVDSVGQRETRQRMTVYYADRVERYVKTTSDESGWLPYEEATVDTEGNEQTRPAVDTEGNEQTRPAVEPWEPGVIPWAHFRNRGMQSDLWDAWPLQDLINKTALDIIATADAMGYPLRIAKGFMPTTDGKPPEDDAGNYLEISPGVWIVIPTDGEYSQSEPADITGLLATLDSYILKLAQVTDTPTSRFQLTRQVAAEGTLKQQEGPLLAKVRARKTLLGNGYEDMLRIATRLANTYTNAGLPEDAPLETDWEPSETRDEKQYLERLTMKRGLGVPEETLWSEMGYGPDEIAEMQALKAEELQQQSNIGGELLRSFEQGMV